MVICNNQELVETNIMLAYLDSDQWLGTINVKINTVDPNGALVNGNRPVVNYIVVPTI